MKNTSIYILAFLLLTSCSYKRYTKQAAKYEEAGLLQQATEKYTDALTAKNTYVDARIGLMRVAILYATELESKIENAYNSQNDNEVVENYHKLEQLYKSTKSKEVNINISERTQGQYAEAKERYIEDNYIKGQNLIEQEQFTEALQHLQCVANISPNYGNSKEMIIYCKAEPIYRDAKLKMDFKKYKSAYYQFDKILEIDPYFKDSQTLMQESLYLGMLTVTFLPVYIPYRNYEPYVDEIISNVNKDVNKANNPFLQMRTLSNSMAFDELQKQAILSNKEIDITQTVPVRAALSCRLPEFTYTRSKLTRTVKKGFYKEIINDSIIFHKVYYSVYEQTAKASLKFSYSLLSVENGSTLFSNSINTSVSDKINYILFDGDKKYLYSGNWEKANTPFSPKVDHIEQSATAIQRMKSLIYGSKVLETETKMTSRILKRASDKLSKELINYNPEKDI